MRQQGARAGRAPNAGPSLSIWPAAPSLAPRQTLARGPLRRPGGAFDASRGSSGPAGGPSLTNTRFQQRRAAGLTADTTPKLTLKWAFGFPTRPRQGACRPSPAAACSSAAMAARSTRSMRVRAASSGASRQADRRPIRRRRRTAPGRRARRVLRGRNAPPCTPGPRRRTRALVHARRHTSERQNYRIARPLSEPALRARVVARGGAGRATRRYECCTFRGSVAALDAANGRLIWQTHTIPTRPSRSARTARASRDGDHRAPRSGRRRPSIRNAAWCMPPPATCTRSRSRRRAMPSSRSAWTTGRSRGRRRSRPRMSSWSAAGRRRGANCPDEKTLGPDFDFGNSPILGDGRRTRPAARRLEVRRRLGARSRSARARSCGSTAPGRGARSAAWSGDPRSTASSSTSPCPTCSERSLAACMR